MSNRESNDLRPIGLLVVDKPSGVTSRHVVDQIQKHLRLQLGQRVKVGHSGTLDPIADGVLVLGIGPATTMLQILQLGNKSYRAEFRLGCTSESFDLESEVTEVAVPQHLDTSAFQKVLPQFRGDILQTPPKFSAIKINGQRAYKLARKGRDFEVPKREVTIESLQLLSADRSSFSFQVTCSGGTYIRTLGREIALAVGTDAVMTKLTRTGSCGISIESSSPLDELLNRPIRQQDLLTPLDVLTHLPSVELTAYHHKRLLDGLFAYELAGQLNETFDRSQVTRLAPIVLTYRDQLAAVVFWDQKAESEPSGGDAGSGQWKAMINFSRLCV